MTRGNACLTDSAGLGIWLHTLWWRQPVAMSSRPVLKTWRSSSRAETCAFNTTAQCIFSLVLYRYTIDAKTQDNPCTELAHRQLVNTACIGTATCIVSHWSSDDDGCVDIRQACFGERQLMTVVTLTAALAVNVMSTQL